jgi:formylglycine-generating enzyme required for sulfatase activity
MTQMFVPAGSFEMGMKVKYDIGGMGYLEAYPGHTVTLDAFWIDQTEVTNKMFAAFIAATGYTPVHDPADSGHVAKAYDIGEDPTSADWQHPNGPGTDITAKANNPVVQVSWNDAFAYCAWAGRRLPTEAEWEKSARDKNGGFYPWGNDANNAPAHYYNYALPWDTVPVGSYPAGASPYGALDMAGNVYEWVNDWYAADFYASLSSWTNPTGPASSPDDQKGVRGGTLAFYNPVFDSVYRDHRGTGYTSNILGFRCATGASSAMSPH